MASADYIYYFTKDTFKKTLYGEIQKGFNMGLVIDGTKDSLKVQVISFSKTEIEPYTICWHEKTNTWWVVAHDKVERDTNENGFIYTHNVQLLGAIELLNARDLTDCGFNQNTYSISDIIFRLCRLSNWEFANDNRLSIEILSSQLDDNMKVDYMKTFENYTLLSALREFLDGYNCDIKLTFDMQIDQETWGDNNYHLSIASFNVVPKTGRSNKTPYSESEFKDIRETRTMDKNSFGTIVISNAENVVSTKTKTYPLVGSVRLSGTEYEITPENGIFRLPSDIFKVISIQVFSPLKVYGKRVSSNGTTIFGGWEVNPFDNSSIQVLINNLKQSFITSYSSGTTDIPDIDDFNEHIPNIKSIIENAIPTIYNSEKYNPATEQIIDLSTDSECRYIKNNVGTFGNVVLTSKDLRDNIDANTRTTTFYWERGKNYIHFPHGGTGSSNGFTFRLGSTSNEIVLYTFIVHGTGITVDQTYTFCVGYPSDYNSGQGGIQLGYSTAMARITYIPMTDLKIKYDNSGERNDTQLYNQNGKLNDGVALSKLMLSYSKEIESDTITKYSNYYDYSKVPQCGDLVSIGNDIYVINNVSLDFEQNETSNNKDYFISGEFTMSKKTSVKSLLTNPNTNIRDYGIPQNNNVVRKQLYRDFYELGHTSDTNASEDYYLPLNKIMNVSNYYQDYQEHIAVIKLGYSDLVDNHSHWYYQLDTTTYMLKKAIYEVVNFNDNNIIGYSSQNTVSEFDIQRVFDTNFDTKNTPISYVDSNGKFESIEIAFCTNEQITTIFEQYKISEGYGSNQKSISNYSCFIPEEIYEGGFSYQKSENFGTKFITREPTTYHTLKINLKDEGLVPQDFTNYQNLTVSVIRCSEVIEGSTLDANFDYTITFTQPYSRNVELGIEVFNNITLTAIGAKHSNDFKVEEEQYNKDALEVPFFEYSCQIDDSNDVVVGDNVLDTKDDGYTYMYSYVLLPKNQVNENNFTRYVVEPSGEYLVDDDFFIYIPNSVGMRYENDKLCIGLRTNDTYDFDSETFTQGGTTTIDSTLLNQLKTHDIMIVRHKVNKHTDIEEIEPEEGVFWYKAHPINDLMFVIRNTNNLVVENNEIVLTINHYTIH